MKQRQTVGIHDGRFHADEVTACALLILYGCVEQDKVIRTRDPLLLSKCEYVCDVGGIYDPEQKLFDHHQASYEGELSSAGMVLLYLKDKGMIAQQEFEHLNNNLVLGVDAHDNGRSEMVVGQCTFSHIISNFNPTAYDAPDDELDRAFVSALSFTLGHLERMRDRLKHTLAYHSLVEQAMARATLCMAFDRPVPWLESFFAMGGERHPALFVLMPSDHQWKLRGIPPDFEHRMQVRLPLPLEWAGLLDEELKQASGIEGAVFCHKGRFTSVWETREDALKALKIVCEKNGVKYEDPI